MLGKITRFAAASAIGLAVAAAPASAAELITNGSFEADPVRTSPGYSRGAPAPSGWQAMLGLELPDVISNDYVAFYSGYISGFRTFLPAKDGTQFLDMNGASPQGGIAQIITGLTPGDTLTLTYWAGSWAQNSHGTLTANLFDPGQVTTTSRSDSFAYNPGATSGQWDQFSLTGTVGASGSVIVQFSGISGNAARAAPALDLVSLIAGPGAVPEPATWLMMILGFGAIGASMRSGRQREPGMARS